MLSNCSIHEYWTLPDTELEPEHLTKGDGVPGIHPVHVHPVEHTVTSVPEEEQERATIQ